MEFDGIRKTLHQIDKIRYRPSILRKIAYGYFRTLVLRKPTLRIIEFSITPACQSSCGYCYAAKFQRSGEKLLSVDEIRDTWVPAKKLGVFTGFVVGGEPSLHKDFLDIMRALEPKKHMVSFATNGISLTEEMLADLEKMGVFVVYVSLNSADPATNDEVRGYEGHFDHAMRIIDLCKQYGIDVMIPVTTSKKLLPETEKMLDFARENGFTSNINLYAPTGRAEGDKEVLFDDEFIGDYLDFSIDQPYTPYPIEWNPRYETDATRRP